MDKLFAEKIASPKRNVVRENNITSNINKFSLLCILFDKIILKLQYQL